MKVHIEIYIRLKHQGSETLHDVLRRFASLSKGWRFPVRKSLSYQTNHKNQAGFALAHSVDGVDRAVVAIANVKPQYPNTFRVTNILPLECSSLSLDKYNAIGEVFALNFRQFLIQRRRGERVQTDGPEIGLAEIIRGLTRRQLFEAYLKTPTPTGHPSDIDILDHFICSISRRDVYVDLDRLSRHLVEDYKWKAEAAVWVVGRIQTGLDILRVRRRFY